MVVRRSDARRRRMVVDPNQTPDPDVGVTAAPKSSAKSKKKKADVRAYSYGADRRNHHKTTDLIPKRTVSYLLVVLTMIASLALINYGAQNAYRWASHIGAEGVGSLAIKGNGTIANWFSSFLLIMTGLASLQIYALRRHRCDDYRGTYRLWGWMAALFLFASVNCIVNLGSIFTHLVQSLTQVSFSEKPWMPIAFKISALSVLIGRGLFEVRESRGSLAWVVLVWLGYTAATVLQLPAARASLVDLQPDMVAGNCVLVATVGLLMAHLTYARFIFLQAHGLIKLKVKKKKVAKPKAVAKKKKAGEESTAKEASDEPSVKKKAAKKTTSKRVAKVAKPKIAKTGKSTKPAPVADSSRAKTSESKTVKTKPVKSKRPESEEAPAKKSPQQTLKEMAAASRAKSKAKQMVQVEEHDDDETEGILKLSKAQRRKQRKAQRNNRRAA